MTKSNFSILRSIGMALALSLALVGCGKGCLKQQAGLQKQSLELIPADSNVILGMNWKKIEASPLGAKIKEGMPKEVALILSNVDGLILGGNFKGMSKDNADFVAIISGKLDMAAVLAQLTEQAKKDGVSLTNEEYEGIKIYGMPKDANLGIAFVDNQGILGSKNAIKKAIDLAKKKGDSVEKNKDLMELVKGVDKDKMLWAVGSIPPGMIPPSEGAGGPANPLASLSGLKALDLSLDFAENLIIELGVITGGKENAQQMVTMANSYKTLFGTSLAMKDPTLGKVLNGLTIDSKDARMNISLKLDKATVDELAKKAAEKQPMPGAEEAPPGAAVPPMPAVPLPAPLPGSPQG